jgi:hypothetical protein
MKPIGLQLLLIEIPEVKQIKKTFLNQFHEYDQKPEN